MKAILALFLLSQVVGASLYLAGCSPDKYEPKPTYYQDSRTGICFAMPENGPSMTQVPCTPEVLKLVK